MCKINTPEWKKFEKLTKEAIEDWLMNSKGFFDPIFEKSNKLNNIKTALKNSKELELDLVIELSINCL